MLLIDGATPVYPAVRRGAGISYDGSQTITEPALHGSPPTSRGVVDASTVYYSSMISEKVRGGTVAQCATYTIRFPVFDREGKPYITSKTKTLVLKMVGPDGGHCATFDLAGYQLPKPNNDK